MMDFISAFQIELLKVRRSKLWLLLLAGFSILPLVCGLFMIILKDPDAAREMGLISMKAQLVAGTAEWATMLGMMGMGISVAGLILFAIFTAWIFGREFSDQTAKAFFAIPISLNRIVMAKFVVTLLFPIIIGIYVFCFGYLIGMLVDIPGWSPELIWEKGSLFATATFLTALPLSWVAFFACFGRGYLPAMGWAFFTLALSQILAVMGWGEWVPWAVPAILTEMSGPLEAPLGIGSYLSVLIVSGLGYVATFLWWQRADQT